MREAATITEGEDKDPTKGVMMHADTPLAGRLMLDMTQGIAGPYCGRLMAEHGARVIKVEPPGGDWVRQIGGGPQGQSVNYLYYNLGKESIELDLKTPEAVALVKRIAAKADVVAESARPGATERLGLSYEAIRAVNPEVIYLSVSGFGQEGPRGRDPMTDTIAQAFSGMMSVNHGVDGIPHKIHTTIVDAITGLYAYQQVTMALMAQQTGQRGGRHIDVSLMQAAAAIMAPKVMEFAHYGETPASPNAPAGSYPTADGWIAITLVREAHFPAIAQAIGRADLADDPKYATFATRLENLAPLMAEISEATRQKTTAEWTGIFEEAGVLASPIHTFGDWLAAPQVVATQGAPLVEVSDGIQSPAPRSPGRAPMEGPAPAIGQHAAAIMEEFSGA
ncbi:MAG: CoA transferase [Pseudomonadota bacterium]